MSVLIGTQTTSIKMTERDDNGESASQPERSDHKPSDSTDNSEEQASREDSDIEGPIERVEKLFAARFDQVESVPQPEIVEDTSSNTLRMFVFTLAVAVVMIALVGGVLVGIQMPTNEFDVNALGPGTSGEASADRSPERLALPAEEARYMNRLFRESTHEVAYCGQLSTDETMPVLAVWKADTVRSDAERIEFKTENCPMNSPEVLLHTHPNGALGLSELDKRTLTNVSAKYMCVQGGQLQIQSGRELTNLACYYQRHSDSDKLALSRIPVILTDTAEDIDR